MHYPSAGPDAADLKEWKVVQFSVLLLNALQRQCLLAYAAHYPAKVRCSIGHSRC